jgi:hypothetical protein
VVHVGAEDVSLAEAIELVRAELRKAQDAGRGSDVRFSVGSVQVELAVTVEKSVGGDASIKVFNIVSVGGKGERSTSAIDRVTVVLNPIGVHGEPFEIASTSTSRDD